LATFGAGITKYFMKPYNEKLWTVSSRTLTADWVAPFVPRPAPADILRGAEAPDGKAYGYNAKFFYPRRGGAQSVVDAFAAGVDAPAYNEAVVRVDDRARFVETSAGRRLPYRHLVSTQPLTALVAQLAHAPADVRAAARRLLWNSVACVNCAVAPADGRRFAGGSHWVYFPGRAYAFYRAGAYSNAAPAMAPEGRAAVYVEISHRPGEAPSNAAAIRAATAGLLRSGLLKDRRELIDARVMNIPHAYVIYDKHRAAAVALITRFLARRGIYSIGRYGAWKYSFMEESIVDGMAAAEKINAARPGS